MKYSKFKQVTKQLCVEHEQAVDESRALYSINTQTFTVSMRVIL
jgi:hypothetical protein